MVRKAEYDKHLFLEAATALVAQGGPSAATMAAIARKAGAPTGSLYHRFPSRNILLAECWISCLKDFAAPLAPLLHAGEGKKVIDHLLDWCDRNRIQARFLFLHDESDIITEPMPEPHARELADVHSNLGQALERCLTGLGAQNSPENLAILKYALFDAPLAALKPVLGAEDPLWKTGCGLARSGYDAAVALLEKP